MNISKPPAELPKDFYVYEHRKATTGEVFYIGKGAGRRAWRHGPGKRSDWWTATAMKHGVVVRVIVDGLQEWAASEIEQDLIALHGRRDCGYGPLINCTDGGDGTSGHMQSDATRAKRSAAVAAALSKPEVKARLIEATSGAEFRHARAIAQKAWWTEERKRARAEQTKARWSDPEFIAKRGVRPVLCVETGQVFASPAAAAASAGERGSSSAIIACCKGKRPKAYGQTWRYAE